MDRGEIYRAVGIDDPDAMDPEDRYAVVLAYFCRRLAEIEEGQDKMRRQLHGLMAGLGGALVSILVALIGTM